MTPKLPLTGVRVEVQNYAGFMKAMETVNKVIENSGKKAQEAAKTSGPLSKALDNLRNSAQRVQGVLLDLASRAGGLSPVLTSVANIIGQFPFAAGLAVAGVTALAAGFLALGNRGAPLIGLGESFDKLTASVGQTSQTMLTELRQAANGTVADFDLIRQTNVALAGAVGQFGEEFGRKLPKLLEIARAQAKATGQSVDFLFQSIVTGIKRGSPLLIDNIGLVLKVGEANEAYAESVGKTVEQLTAEEKQIAILNATLEAGQTVLDIYGQQQETNAEKLARAQATITNTLDGLAIAVQPAFGTVLDIVNRVLSGFQQLAIGLAPILGAIASIVTNVLGGAFNIVLDILQPFINAITSVLPYVAILFQGIANVIGGVINVIRNVVGGIVNFLKDVARNFFGLDLDNLGPNLFNGAAKAFGAFANGIIAVANRLIFPAVIGIAQFIADLLIGLSPPPKGPLSVIDKGGENLMNAWLEGITGVSLQPVEDVAAEVSMALGSIGKAGLGAVEKRLAELDKALLPFQNRLDIVKARFDAIAAPGQAALDAIDRQLQAAQEALAGGDVAAAETIKTLDAQRAAIQANLDAQQGIVDRSQIQLALAQAQQAQERSLLNIRKAQLQVVKKVAGETKEGVGKEERPKAGAGAGPAEAALANAGITMPTGGDSVLDLIGGQQAVDDAIAGIQDAFVGEIDTKNLLEFGANQALLQEQLDRIGGVDLGSKLAEKFSGVTDLFNPDVDGSPANKIKSFFTTLTGDETTPGSIASFFSNLGPNIQTAVSTLTGDASTPGSLASFFATLGPNIDAAIAGAGDTIKAAFDPEADGSPANFIVNAVRTLTGDDATADSLASMFAMLPENVATAASGLWTELDTQVFTPVRNFLVGTGEGTLSGIIDSVVQFFTDLPSRIVAALQGFGATVYNALAVPVINVVNGLIGIVEGAIKGIIEGIAAPFQTIVDTFGDATPAFIRDIATNLLNTANGISFGRISTELPAFLQSTPGAATGGQFGPGMLKVGERGPEYLYNAQKVGVLPNDLLRAIDGIGSILAQPSPMLVPGGGDTYNNSNSYTFNGVQSDNDARRRYNSLRAGMR